MPRHIIRGHPVNQHGANLRERNRYELIAETGVLRYLLEIYLKPGFWIENSNPDLTDPIQMTA